MSAPSPPLPRASLAAVCAIHASILGLLAAVLPWRSGTWFALLLTLLAALHLATALLAIIKPALLGWSVRALSAGSTLVCAVSLWSALAMAAYVRGLYPRLGPLVVSGIALGFALLALLTLPIAIWGALRTWPPRVKEPRRVAAGAGALLGLYVLSLPLVGRAAQSEAMPLVNARVTSDLGDLLDGYSHDAPAAPRRNVAGAGPARCHEPLGPERLTLLVAYVARSGRARSSCLQARNSRELRRELGSLLSKRARTGSPIVLDLVKAQKQLSRGFPLLDAFELRPGLDGVCEEGSCAPAWQLALSDAFADNRPLAAIPEATFGFSPRLARKLLGVSADQRGRDLDGLLRIETESLAVDEAGVHHLARTRATPPALDASGIAQALAAAESFIVAAQESDGSFRYSIDPASGDEDRATLNLPRQAGTAYALCELGRQPALPRTVARALTTFEAREHRFADVSALEDAGELGLGKSALPLVALLRCRKLVGADNDRLIGQLARLLLRMQRADGSFYPIFDPKLGRGSGNHELMYAAGQALLALVLLEQQQAELASGAAAPLPAPSSLKSVIDRGMAHYAGPYWPAPLRDFFFLEEGWHCQAARHALSSHPSAAYEKLCLDYVASRMRFVARKTDTSDANFVGGYGLGDLFPPSNTATSGLGEALDAAISIKQRRGLPVETDKALLRDLVTFLLRAQWTASGCYGCREPELVVGGFSQQLGAASIRIDYVQHAMSALGHAGALLF